jgi:hypothetical protein
MRFNQTQRFQTVNYDDHIADLKDRFARLVWALGPNRGRGTIRYTYEVDFAYALNEIEQGPLYFRGKLVERATAIVNSLVGFVKALEAPAERL